tara:strand:+ start:21561 stop:21791 length:231 start_codon:yes stop_codon:yes gene_type:complete
MVVRVVGKKNKFYTTVCTDDGCRNILEFDSSDIKQHTISCMGRDGGSKMGIGCPSCAQIITPEHFTEIKEYSNVED